MSLAAEIDRLKNQAAITTEAVRGAFDRKTEEAFTADNALKLGDQSREQMISTSGSMVASHANNTNNPHGTTTETIGTYSAAVIDQKLGALVPKSILPFSQFGNPDNAVPLVVNLSPFALSVAFGATPVFISGDSYVAPAVTHVLTNNTVTYFYLKLVAGQATITFSLAQEPESSTVMFIGKVRFAAGAVAENTIDKVTRIDIYRVSKVPAGSAIPVSIGFPGDPANLAWK